MGLLIWSQIPWSYATLTAPRSLYHTTGRATTCQPLGHAPRIRTHIMFKLFKKLTTLRHILPHSIPRVLPLDQLHSLVCPRRLTPVISRALSAPGTRLALLPAGPQRHPRRILTFADFTTHCSGAVLIWSEFLPHFPPAFLP